MYDVQYYIFLFTVDYLHSKWTKRLQPLLQKIAIIIYYNARGMENYDKAILSDF